MPSVPFRPSDQSLNLKNMIIMLLHYLYRLPWLVLELRLLDCRVDIYMSRQNQIEV